MPVINPPTQYITRAMFTFLKVTFEQTSIPFTGEKQFILLIGASCSKKMGLALGVFFSFLFKVMDHGQAINICTLKLQLP